MAQGMHTSSFSFCGGNANCGNTADSFNPIFYISDEEIQIHHWLSPLESGHYWWMNRFEGIGDWILETREFGEWRGGTGGADKAILFCSGNAGVGKTYLR